MILSDFIEFAPRYCEANSIDPQKISTFRNVVQTIYLHYKMERKLAYNEKSREYYKMDFEDTDEYEDFFYEWNYYPYDWVGILYTKTGWKLEDEFSNMEPSYDEESGEFFYKIDFFDVYEKIVSHIGKTPGDDICFLFCILVLIDGISNRELYDGFAQLVKNTLFEYKLINLLDVVSDGKKQIFVAMCYAPDMEKARYAIKEAIINKQYNAMVIDEKEYSNFIVPEMLMEIERSVIVVADLTHQRGGVYYEAGYARAFDIPVIMTCKEQDFDNVHFDVKQMNIIKWENEEDLKNKLSRRIEALLRKRYKPGICYFQSQTAVNVKEL